MISVIPYESGRRAEWDELISRAKNATFLFYRDYMEYHADRFRDGSVMVYSDDVLIAVVPANITGDEIVSHGGLTFGGVICTRRMRTATMVDVFDAMRRHFVDRGIRRVLYKRIPYIYHDVPADEDMYALFMNEARVTRRDVSAAILMSDRLPYTKGRKWSVGKGRKAGLRVEHSVAFEAFMELEAQHLQARYGARPVHTGQEMALLASRFPDNIKLFTASLEERIVAGVIIYQTRNVAHVQYIGTTPEGREVAALDAILDHLLCDIYAHHRYFDFGISNEQEGRVLNTGLIENKESYGARAVVHEFFELSLA